MRSFDKISNHGLKWNDGAQTIIAWIRTSVSLISFGFTIFQFLAFMIERVASVGDRAAEVRAIGKV